MVQRAPRNAGTLDDVLARRPGEAVLREQLACRAEQRLARRRRALSLCATRVTLVTCFVIDRHRYSDYRCRQPARKWTERNRMTLSRQDTSIGFPPELESFRQ